MREDEMDGYESKFLRNKQISNIEWEIRQLNEDLEYWQNKDAEFWRKWNGKSRRTILGSRTKRINQLKAKLETLTGPDYSGCDWNSPSQYGRVK